MSGQKGDLMPIYTDKKTNRLFIQFDFQGTTYKKRLPKNTTKKDAEKLEIKYKNKLFFEANGIESKRDITFEDFLTEYFLPYAETHYVKGSFDTAVHLCKAALPFLKGKSLRRIQAADIERFKNARTAKLTKHDTTRKPATIVRELGVISKVFSYAIKNDFLEFNPCSRVERPLVDNLQDQILSQADRAKFLASFQSDWARDVCELILNTGLRQNDALGLTKFNVDWNLSVIRLLQGKTGRKVEIPMNYRVKELLQAHRHNGSDLFFPSPKTGKQGTSLKKAIAGACRRAKISTFGTRVLRRTFGTLLDELNYSSSVKAKLLGHTDLRSVHRYERGKDILREAVESLPQGVNPAKILPLNSKETNKIAVNG